ncbi:MAG TPA: PfkB family carbohydrate kinase, partial [Opitutaceae bacterium]
MPSSLAIVGCTVVDIIFPDTPRLPRWPRHTEFTAANLIQLPRAPLVTIGGNGANAAYVAARRGARVTLHTAIGDDILGGLAHAWLRDAGC